ncbi:YdcF family protein [Pseudoalteromonas sp. MMG022]|uniref:YdcF family protein n=1 Tax=Pseudoalteromonas sp. MMG022 TaxID=2909978 RepID=UPI001F28FFA5|nr:YdcF family protein [Pseudoalteromonas sp. MMG022]MCF6436340.1 YdcF family protein [Pseudoalteromonas sp. MMG022]
MFLFKKVLGGLLMPLPLSLIIVAICLLFVSKANLKSYIMLWLTVIALWCISTPFFASKITTSAESQWHTFDVSKHPRIDKIVVLGCGVHPNSQQLANAQLTGCSSARLIEGLRLAHHYKSAELIVSGHLSSPLMKQTVIALGIPSVRVRANPSAMDTKDEAKLLAPYLVDRQVALVTSASHMARAKNLFWAQGVDTIAAPTQFHNLHNAPDYKQFIAQVSVLEAVTTHYHEMLGTLWIKVRRIIDPEAL